MMHRRLLLSLLGCFLVTSALLAWNAYPRPKMQPIAAGDQADRIVVRKSQREMILWRNGEPLKAYAVALGRGEPGAKRREGDNRTPEGSYRISGRNPQSAYHLSLRISYPEARDIANAQARGEPPGSDIMIHGIRNGFGWLGPLHRYLDWTAGCVAVTNKEIEEIWGMVPDGTPIEIIP